MRKIAVTVAVLMLCLTVATGSVAILNYTVDNYGKKTTIVFFGDSIAEGVLGPSPACERDTLGYYGIIGEINDVRFYNRAVSGYQSAQALRLLRKDDDSAYRTKTLLASADVVVISLIGNDLLQTFDLSGFMMAASNTPADFSAVDAILTQSKINFQGILDIIYELNPKIMIAIQTLYNPVTRKDALINQTASNHLAANGYPTLVDQRAVAKTLLDRLNRIFFEVKDENPKMNIEIVDVYTAFNNVFVNDMTAGERLMFNDDIHPSNEGHALIAATIQDKLVEKNLVYKNIAIKNYKKLTINRLNRLFAPTATYESAVDIKGITESINACESITDISEVYFNGVRGIMPNYL